MTLSVRMQAAPNQVLRHPSGRTYVCDSNGTVTVAPYSEMDQLIGQARILCLVGSSDERPSPDPMRPGWPSAAIPFLDTSVGALLVWQSIPGVPNTAGWVNAATGAPA